MNPADHVIAWCQTWQFVLWIMPTLLTVLQPVTEAGEAMGRVDSKFAGKSVVRVAEPSGHLFVTDTVPSGLLLLETVEGSLPLSESSNSPLDTALIRLWCFDSGMLSFSNDV